MSGFEAKAAAQAAAVPVLGRCPVIAWPTIAVPVLGLRRLRAPMLPCLRLKMDGGAVVPVLTPPATHPPSAKIKDVDQRTPCITLTLTP